MSWEMRLMPKGRFEAFSDGVYAIVITLLVLEFRVPESSDPLVDELIEAWPTLLAYFVSFAFIGASWVAHNELTRSLAVTDNVVVGLNLLLLLFVTFLPFTTAVMGTHLNGPGQRLAVFLFGLNLTLATAINAVLCTYVTTEPDLIREGAESDLRSLTKARWSWTAFWAASTLIGALLPNVAVFLYLAVSASALILVEPIRLFQHRRRRRAGRNAH
ncbi:MAG: TMEM175 family protein [Mycobacterium sp.]